MRAPDDVAWEHANCPHHVHVSVVSVTAGDEFTTLETRVSRVLRGSLVRGQVVSFAVRLPDADDFGEGGVSSEWLSRQGHFEVCLTETLELPSVDSLWALDGPGDGVHLQLPPACTVCPDGFLERVVEGPKLGATPARSGLCPRRRFRWASLALRLGWAPWFSRS